MVSHLASTRDPALHTSRVPRTDARNFAKTTVRLAGQPGDAPASDNAVDPVTLGGADDVDHLVLLEDVGDLDLLLEEADAEVDLLRGGAAVDLDLLDVSLLLAASGLRHLGVADGTDVLAVLLHPLDLGAHGGAALLARLAPALLVLAEGLLLARVPPLVEAALALLAQVSSPHAGQRAHAAGGVNVADEPDDYHRRGLQDAHRLTHLLLVELGAGLVDVAHNVGHACLVGHEGGQMTRFRRVILGESLDLSEVVLGALPGQESKGAVPGALELTVGHGSSWCLSASLADLLILAA